MTVEECEGRMVPGRGEDCVFSGRQDIDNIDKSKLLISDLSLRVLPISVVSRRYGNC